MPKRSKKKTFQKEPLTFLETPVNIEHALPKLVQSSHHPPLARSVPVEVYNDILWVSPQILPPEKASVKLHKKRMSPQLFLNRKEKPRVARLKYPPLEYEIDQRKPLQEVSTKEETLRKSLLVRGIECSDTVIGSRSSSCIEKPLRWLENPIFYNQQIDLPADHYKTNCGADEPLSPTIPCTVHDHLPGVYLPDCVNSASAQTHLGCHIEQEEWDKIENRVLKVEIPEEILQLFDSPSHDCYTSRETILVPESPEREFGLSYREKQLSRD